MVCARVSGRILMKKRNPSGDMQLWRIARDNEFEISYTEAITVVSLIASSAVRAPKTQAKTCEERISASQVF